MKPEYFKTAQSLTEEQKREFIIKDNISNGIWDTEALAKEWADLPLVDWGLNLPNWLNKDYSQKLGEVIYEPKETNHKVSDLFQKETKFDKEIQEVKNEELKELLKARVLMFYNFDFAKIADYYAYQATPEEQRIMEKLALVLLDKDKLIENGFSKLIDSLDKEDEVYEEQP